MYRAHDKGGRAQCVCVRAMKGEQVHRIGGGGDTVHTRPRHGYNAVQESADRRDGSRFATAQVEKRREHTQMREKIKKIRAHELCTKFRKHVQRACRAQTKGDRIIAHPCATRAIGEQQRPNSSVFESWRP